MLSPLARLLDTDLNALLAFHDNLTEAEIGEGFVTLSNSTDLEKSFEKEIVQLYQRIESTTDEKLRFKVTERLFYLSLNQEKLEEAETLLKKLPTDTPDAVYLNALLAQKKVNYAHSSQLLESNLLRLLTAIQQHLSLLVVNALREEEIDLAQRYAKAASELAIAFELWEYNQYTLPLDSAIATQNQQETIRLMESLLKVGKQPWNLDKTELYSHIPRKEVSQRPAFIEKMLRESFLGNPELAFVQSVPAFQELFAVK